MQPWSGSGTGHLQAWGWSLKPPICTYVPMYLVHLCCWAVQSSCGTDRALHPSLALMVMRDGDGAVSFACTDTVSSLGAV